MPRRDLSGGILRVTAHHDCGVSLAIVVGFCSTWLAVTSAAVTDCESCLRQREVTACRCADPATDR